MAMDDQAGLGPAGEQYAERFLRRRRYRIVTRNYNCPMGEIDIVALDGRTIVFVEVKTRTGREHADPQDAVNAAKQKHLTRAGEFFLRQTQSEDRVCRFDVVAITVSAANEWDVEHLIDAFTPV
jgi:putative endonuclease